MGNQILEVAFTTTVEDYVNYSSRAVSRTPMMRARFLALWLLLPAALLARGITLIVGDSWEAGLALVLVGSLYLAVYPFYYRNRVAHVLRKYLNELGTSGIVGPIRLQLTEESLVEMTSSVRTEACWRNMVGMEVVGDCTYIQITPLSAAIIPKRGFEREEEYFAVRDFALARLNRTPHASAKKS